jgi:hypothetical protein
MNKRRRKMKEEGNTKKESREPSSELDTGSASGGIEGHN